MIVRFSLKGCQGCSMHMFLLGCFITGYIVIVGGNCPEYMSFLSNLNSSNKSAHQFADTSRTHTALQVCQKLPKRYQGTNGEWTYPFSHKYESGDKVESDVKTVQRHIQSRIYFPYACRGRVNTIECTHCIHPLTTLLSEKRHLWSLDVHNPEPVGMGKQPFLVGYSLHQPLIFCL